MPSDWTYHADGVQTAVKTSHDLSGALKSVTVQMDTFKVREWTEEEIEDSQKDKQHLHYAEEKDAYDEFGSGAHATVRYSVDGTGAATLTSIEAEDGDKIKPRHMAILPATERVVSQLRDVEVVHDTIETLATAYHNAGDVFIDKLDGD